MSIEQKVYENNPSKTTWKRPWERPREDFKSIEMQDDRFFSILMKGVLSYLNNNIVMYGKSIKHYILQSGTEYLYVEQNGYEYSLSETSGENTLYSQIPRCVVEMGDISIQKDGLSSPYSRGVYERVTNEGELKTYNSEMRRLPLQLSLTLKYVLSNYNESIILVEELMNNMIWQKYFKINYLGQNVECSIEFPDNMSISFNKPDFDSKDAKQRTISLSLTLKTNYPQINTRTEIDSDKVINGMIVNVNPHNNFPKDRSEIKLDEDNTQKIY